MGGLEPFAERILAPTSVVALGVVDLTHSLGYDSPKPASAQTVVSAVVSALILRPGTRWDWTLPPCPAKTLECRKGRRSERPHCRPDLPLSLARGP